MSEYIQSYKVDGVLMFILVCVDKKNVIIDVMYGVLVDVLSVVECDNIVCVVLLCVEGDMFFVGNDIGEFVLIVMVGGKGGGECNVICFLYVLVWVMCLLVVVV